MTSDDKPPAIASGQVLGTHPLTHQQEGLARMMLRAGDRHAYWMPRALGLHGCNDYRQLMDALRLVAARHPALRTRFVPTENGGLGQVVEHAAVAIEDLGDLDRHDLAAAVRAFNADAAALDVLAGDPPWRVAVGRCEGETVVAGAAHHLVFDEWSWALLLNDLGAASRHLRRADAMPARSPSTYTNYARWQRHHLVGAIYDYHLAHWRRLTEGYPPAGLALTGRSALPRPPSGPAATLKFAVDPGLVRAVDGLASCHGATRFVVLLAVFLATLAALSGRRDVLCGVVTANRRRPDLRDVIGFFANGRILRHAVVAASPVDDHIVAVARQWAAGHRHQELHLEKTLLDIGLPDLANIKFGLRNVVDYLPAPDFGDGVVPTPLADPEATTARRDLSLWLTPDGPGLVGYATYRTDALTGTDAKNAAVAYVDNLRLATTDPRIAIGHFAPGGLR